MSHRCIAIKKNGRQCTHRNNNVFKYCWTHTRSIKGIILQKHTDEFKNDYQTLITTKELKRNQTIIEYIGPIDVLPEWVMQAVPKRLPVFFHFKGGTTNFRCELKEDKCNTRGCHKRVVLAHPKCKEHGRKHLKLDIDISTRPEHGLGLFAYCHNNEDVKRVCFNKNDVIVEYIGDIIDKKELLRRYGKNTSPYALEFDNKKEYIDPACCRGYGAYANHRPIHECNAKFDQRYPNKIEIIATKAIKNREEIFVNYGNKYRFNETYESSTDPFPELERSTEIQEALNMLDTSEIKRPTPNVRIVRQTWKTRNSNDKKYYYYLKASRTIPANSKLLVTFRSRR